MVANATILFRRRMMKKKFVMNRDRIFSMGMALVSILIMVLTVQIKPTFGSISGSDPGSKAFPFGIAILLLLSSIGKFITCSKPDEKPFVEGKEGWFKILSVLILLLLYTVLMKYIGFIICSFLGTALLLWIMRGQRKISIVTYIVYPAVLTAVLYILFNNILQVIMPIGLLWNAIL